MQDIRSGNEKVYTAQVLRSWYTLPGNVFLTSNQLIFTHDHFAPAKTVLRESVHFLGFEKDSVKFMEFDPEADMFNLRKNPILFISQTALVKKLIILPLHVFEDLLAEAYTEKNTKVVWCFHTIRCGSTVWSQMFAALPKWVAYSESQSMFYNVLRSRNTVDVSAFAKTEEYEKMVVATVKMHILMAPKDHSIFWKTTGIDEHMVSIIRKHFPSHHIVFAWRDCLPCATSYFKAFGHLPVLVNNVVHANREIADKSRKLSDSGRVGWLWHTNGYDLDFCLRILKTHKPQPNAFEWFVMLWAAKVSMMAQYRRDGIKFKPLKYERLRKDTAGIVTELFQYLDIPLDLVEIALKTMEFDSQAGTFFSHEERVDHESWSRTPESDRRCNGILRDFGLPDLDTASEF